MESMQWQSQFFFVVCFNMNFMCLIILGRFIQQMYLIKNT